MLSLATNIMNISDPYLLKAANNFQRGLFDTKKKAFESYLTLAAANGFTKTIKYSQFCERLGQLINFKKLHVQEMGAKNSRKDLYMTKGFYKVDSPHTELQIDAQTQAISLLHPLYGHKNYQNLRIEGTKVYTAINPYSKAIAGSIFTTAKGEAAGYYVELLKRSILPTLNMTEHYGCEYNNNVYGMVENIRSDAGTALDSLQLFQFMQAYKFDTTIGGGAQKNGIIEWYHGHRQKIFLSRLPGYYHKSRQVPESVRLENLKKGRNNAALTPFEFEVLHYRYESDIYSQQAINGKDSPYKQTATINRSAIERSTLPANAHSISSYKIELPNKATIQKNKGIQFAQRFYNSQELTSLYFALIKKMKLRQVSFMFNPINRESIIVRIPPSEGGGNITVPMIRAVKEENGIDIENLMYSELRNDTLQKLKTISSDEIIAKAKERRDKTHNAIKAEKRCIAKVDPITEINKELLSSSYAQEQYTQTNKFDQETHDESKLLDDQFQEPDADLDNVEVG